MVIFRLSFIALRCCCIGIKARLVSQAKSAESTRHRQASITPRKYRAFHVMIFAAAAMRCCCYAPLTTADDYEAHTARKSSTTPLPHVKCAATFTSRGPCQGKASRRKCLGPCTVVIASSKTRPCVAVVFVLQQTLLSAWRSGGCKTRNTHGPRNDTHV